MRTTSKKHFVYKWVHTTGYYYIGKHSGTETDGYTGSGKLFRACFDQDRDSWTRTILSFYPSSSAALDGEKKAVGTKWKYDPLCLNLCPGGKVHHKAMLGYYQEKLHNLMLKQFDSICENDK